jgi:hypothetical protein
MAAVSPLQAFVRAARKVELWNGEGWNVGFGSRTKLASYSDPKLTLNGLVM